MCAIITAIINRIRCVTVILYAAVRLMLPILWARGQVSDSVSNRWPWPRLSPRVWALALQRLDSVLALDGLSRAVQYARLDRTRKRKIPRHVIEMRYVRSSIHPVLHVTASHHITSNHITSHHIASHREATRRDETRRDASGLRAPPGGR